MSNSNNTQSKQKTTTQVPSPTMMGRGRGPAGGRFKKVEKPKNVQGAISRLWGYLKHEQLTLILVVLLTILLVILSVVAPYLMGKAIDDGLSMRDQSTFNSLIVLMLGAYILTSLVTWLQRFIMIGVSQRTLRKMRSDLFSKLQTLSIGFFDTHSHGELMSRLTNDIDNISNTLTSSFTQLTSSLFTIIGVSVMMLVLNWRLGLITLISLPVVLFGIQPIVKRTRKGYALQQKNLGVLNGMIEESITGQKVVKIYCREDMLIEEFQKANENLTNASYKARILAGIMGPLMNVINNLNYAIVVGVGSIMAINGLATIGVIASFTNYTRQFSRPLNSIASLFNEIQSALAGAERVFEIMDQETDVKDKPDAPPINPIKGKVEFTDVNFSYTPGQPILKNINLTAQPGEMIALVGPTGAGKTTIVNLLTRYYDIDSGSIKIDDVDIRDIQKDSLRQRLGIVLQDSYLFSGTVREAIMYGKPTATEAEVEEAARLAHADIFIHRLLNGYDTELVSEGTNISQGQRQLLTIARAALANPDILILDEATSSVDTRTELIIQEAMQKLMADRTSFVIAHRLSTIRKANTILVVNDGQIIERGTHDELLSLQGFYADLYYSQFQTQITESSNQIANS